MGEVVEFNLGRRARQAEHVTKSRLIDEIHNRLHILCRPRQQRVVMLSQTGAQLTARRDALQSEIDEI